MPISTSNGPYYDDFDSSKNYHQILFKPGFAVQARELTQIQSIIKDQITTFGNHIFKHGSVVIPGNSYYDTEVCFVKLNPLINPLATNFIAEGKIVVGTTSGLRALVRKYITAELSDPSTLYVNYYNTGNAGETKFLDSETLTFEESGVVAAVGTSLATGTCTMAFVNKGVYFVNGTFVTVLAQSIVIDKYEQYPSVSVMLKITESIIDTDGDNSLLDPAQGSYNYAAPGADRLKIELTLTAVPLISVTDNNYIEIMRFNNGLIENHAKNTKYSELEKALARRTYDESGDYVISGGLKVTAQDHLKQGLNGGRYSAPIGDSSKFIYNISPGKAYIQGFENENISSKAIVSSKARTTDFFKSNIIPSYGQYIRVTDLVNLPDFTQKETITFYDSSSGGAIVATAKALAIDYYEPNTTDSNAIFSFYLTDLVFNSGKNAADLGRGVFSSGSFNVVFSTKVSKNNALTYQLSEVISNGGTVARTAIVLKHNTTTNELFFKKNLTIAPTIGDIVIGATSTASGKIIYIKTLHSTDSDDAIFNIPKKYIASVVGPTGIDISYKSYYTTTVTCIGGAGSFSVTGQTIDAKEQGNFIITTSTGVIPLSVVTISPDGLTATFSGVTPATAILKIVCSTTKSAGGASPKTKTLTTVTETGLARGTTIQLLHADGLRATSVISTVDGDVTGRYILDGGQRDFAYERSSLILTGVSPASGTLSVTYEYFTHNAGSGDYFSINSYISSNLPDYFESYYLNYKSKSTNVLYNLRDCLDFRPRMGINGTYSGTGSSTNLMVVQDSRITLSFSCYLPRYDSIIMNKDGQIKVIEGVPGENAVIPSVGNESLLIAAAFVPAYTNTAQFVRIVPGKNRAYTMQDIGALDARVSNLEEYTTLSATEQSAINYDIIDAATGLSRLKTGYVVDNFMKIEGIADVLNENFKVAFVSNTVIPQFEVIEAPMLPLSLGGQFTGKMLTLPYTEIVAASQPLSSGVTNINPFSVFSWRGQLQLTPNSDTWAETNNLAVIYRSESETVVNNVYESVEISIPSPPTAGPVIPYNNTAVLDAAISAYLDGQSAILAAAQVPPPPPPEPPAPIPVPTVPWVDPGEYYSYNSYGGNNFGYSYSGNSSDSSNNSNNGSFSGSWSSSYGGGYGDGDSGGSSSA